MEKEFEFVDQSNAFVWSHSETALHSEEGFNGFQLEYVHYVDSEKNNDSNMECKSYKKFDIFFLKLKEFILIFLKMIIIITAFQLFGF